VLTDYVPNLKQNDYHVAAIGQLKTRNAAEVANCIRSDITEAGAYIFEQLSIPVAKDTQTCVVS
jgi:hypothetical protein